MITFQDIRENTRTFEIWRPRLFVVLGLLLFSLIPVFSIHPYIRMALLSFVPVILGVYTVLYIRQTDLERMRQWGHIVTPSLLTMVVIIVNGILFSEITSQISIPTPVFDLSNPLSAWIETALLSLLWTYVCVIRVYQRRIILFQRNMFLKNRIEHDTQLTKLKEEVKQLSEDDRNPGNKELADLFNRLLDEARAYSQKQVLPEDIRELVPIRVAKSLALTIPIAGTVFIGLVTEALIELIKRIAR